MSLVDLSYDLAVGMPVVPGHAALEIAVLDTTGRAAPIGTRAVNLSRLTIGLHCGTHMDAPFHFIESGRTMEQVPLAQCAGPAVLVRLPEHGPRAAITEGDLARYRDALREARKVALSTGWERRWGQPEYFSDHPVITPEAAHYLLECGVHLVGVDFPSVDTPPHETHVVLLSAGAVIVENLTNLDAIRGDRFQLIALPLRIVGRDGSPVRAVGMPL
jgi:arylformamidase